MSALGKIAAWLVAMAVIIAIGFGTAVLFGLWLRVVIDVAGL